MCSSQRSQAFEFAATTERLQVGGGYVVLIETSHKALAKLKGLGHAILGNFSTDRMVVELTKISK